MASFSDSKDGKQWWRNLELVQPHLNAYCDSYMRGTEIVGRIKRLCMNASHTDENVVAIGQQFQRLWEVAPDSPRIHSYPGWDLICDLASEYTLAL